MSKTSEALEDRERPARPVHPSCLYLTFLDPSAVVVSRLTYASTAWCGFVTASNIQRVDAFLRRSQRCGFCPPNPSDFSEQLTECDDRLFNRIRRHNGNTSCTSFCRHLPPPSRTTTCEPAGPGREVHPNPSPPARGLGSAVSSPSGVRGEAPAATWRFISFYRLTKLLLVSILLILVIFISPYMIQR